MTKFGSRVVFGTGEARVAPANSRAIWASILSTRRIYARNACSRPRPRDGATPALPRAAHSAHEHLSERARARRGGTVVPLYIKSCTRYRYMY